MGIVNNDYPHFSTMKPTIIFISGWSIPNFIAKTKLIWDEKLWKNYNCIWVESIRPKGDLMIEQELRYLASLVKENPGCIVVGQSLGAWWASNLALQANLLIKKLVLWTPVCDVSAYPIFKASRKFHPAYQKVKFNHGPHRVLTISADRDLLVPADAHGNELSKLFLSMNYDLKGGHFIQSNHSAALQYMKDWIET